MDWMTDSERELATAVAELTYCNPFLHDRIQLERRILGDEFIDSGVVWHAQDEVNPNLERIQHKVDLVTRDLLARLDRVKRPKRDDLRLYRDLVIYHLFGTYEKDFLRLVLSPKRSTRRAAFFRTFQTDYESYSAATHGLGRDLSAAHLFAFLFQVRRAFHLIFRQIVGGSMPAARLRAAVWHSVFTLDMRRYRRSLYRRMGDITTLITGESGTGKEIVARAVGMSRYIPFSAETQSFAEDFRSSFYPLNLSALSPTLIESELFGHRRGAFTGALENRPGWLEVCPPLGTVFLDEIGEVEPAIQVKLLRVLETRAFQRLGDTRDRQFAGKVIAATNRDLETEMRSGTTRRDFYYRLCSDLISTPSLEEQVRDAPEELNRLIRFLAERVAGAEEAEELTREVRDWIRRELGSDYRWPGNVRELEQCVRNVMIRGEYHPANPDARPEEDVLAGAYERGWTLAELERRYVGYAYRKAGSYVGAGKRLGLDRRTVKAKAGEEG